jgi:Tfp pilus assembly protein PilX
MKMMLNISIKQNPKARFLLSLLNEDGNAIVVAMIMLALLTIIGVAGISTSNIETLISTTEMEAQEAFYAADGGIQYGLQQVATVIAPAGNYTLDDTDMTITATQSTDLSVTQREGSSIAFGGKVLKKFQNTYTITSTSSTNGTKTLEASATAEVWEPR